MAFEFTVKTDNVGTSNDDQFTLPLPGAGVYNYTIDWGDGGAPEAKATNTSVTHTFLGGAGTYNISITGTFPQIYFNDGGDKLKLLSVEDLGDVGWTSFASAFYGCSNMTAVAADTVDTSSVTTMYQMFYNCSSVTVLDVSGFDTALVTSMTSMFRGCSSITVLDVSGFDTALVTSMTSMFRGCSSITVLDVSGFDTALVTSMASMFYGCSSVTVLDVSGFDTALVTTMAYMFYGCSSVTVLDVSGFDTALVTTMVYMFYGCSSLDVDVSGFDTALVTSMTSMFYGCSSVTVLDVSGFDTALVTTMAYMFYGCSSLDVDVSGFDITQMTDATNMFNGSAFSQTNYDKLLVAWEAQVEQAGVTFHAGTAQFSSGAPATAKTALETNTWTITDGGQSTMPGWSDETDATIASDTSPHSDTKCLKVTAGAANVGVNQFVALVTGRYYTVSGWAKVTAGDSAQIRVDTGDGTMLTIGTVTTTSWTQVQATFLATGTQGYLYMRAVADTDIVWFDDISILLCDEADASTAIRTRDFAGGKIDLLRIDSKALPAAGIKRLRDKPYEMLS